MVRLAAGPASGNYRAVRQNMSEFLQIGRIFDKDGREVESDPSGANSTPLDFDGVGKGMGKECSRSRSERLQVQPFSQAKGKGQSKGKTKSTSTDKNTPAKFEGKCRHCGKKGHKWADCRKRLAEAKDKNDHAVDGAPSTATVAAEEDTEVIDEPGMCGDCSDDVNNRGDTSEAWVPSVEGNDKPVDAEFLLLDSACEEHICPWNFAECGRDLGPSNVQLRNATGLSIPSGRRRPLRSVGNLTMSSAENKFGSKGSWIDLHTASGV